ncbi:MAG: PilT/PilU family type 4a pilus ATPase [Candidatus Bruticola sp.]
MARRPRSKSDSDLLDSNVDMSVEGRLSRLEAGLEDISLVGDTTSKEILKLSGRFERLSADFDEIAEGASAEDLAQVQGSLDEMSERFKIVEETLEAKNSEFAANSEAVRTELDNLNTVSSNAAEKLSALEVSFGERLDALKEEVSQASTFAKSEDFENYKLEQIAVTEALEERLKAESAELRTSLDLFKEELSSESEKQSAALNEKMAENSDLLKLEISDLKSSLDSLRESLNGADNVADKLKAVNDSVEALQSRLEEYAPKFDDAVAKAEESQSEIDKHLSAIKMAMRLVEQLDERVRDIGKNAEAVTAAAASAVEAAPQIAATVAQAASAAASVSAVTPKATAAEPVEEDDPIPAITENLGYDLDDILQVVISHRASDLHLQVGNTPTVRLSGDLVPVGDTKLAQDDTKALVYPAMTREQRREVKKGREVSFAHVASDGTRFIVNAFLERGNLSANFHMQRTDILDFDVLGLPPILKKLSLYQSGLIILTGPTGSGKSTTMASIVDYINNNRKCHIVTVEDPIEYYHKTVNSLITQREVGTDTQSFNDAICMAMRQDPDVLVISDIKDADTLMAAATAAEKGYLVVAAMNVPDTVQAVRRMLSSFTGETQRQFRLLLASCLRGVISQKLIARSDDKGRVPAVEVLVVDMAVSDSILNDNLDGLAAYLQQGTVEGMQSFNQSVGALYSRGLIAKDEEQFHEEPSVQDFPVVDNEIHLQEQSNSEMSDNDTIMNWL